MKDMIIKEGKEKVGAAMAPGGKRGEAILMLSSC
jgi:hypothetical protein